MADRKKLQKQLDELRGEIAALRAERAVAREAAVGSAAHARVRESERSGKRGAEAEQRDRSLPDSLPDRLAAAAAGKTGELERILAELLETTEAEIAEHPALVAGLAFLAGFAVGRMSKG